MSVSESGGEKAAERGKKKGNVTKGCELLPFGRAEYTDSPLDTKIGGKGKNRPSK